MTLTVVNSERNEADAKWGYRFGEDGIINLEDAAAMLAKASTQTVENRIKAGKIRSGKDVGRLVICKKSLVEYIAGLEK